MGPLALLLTSALGGVTAVIGASPSGIEPPRAVALARAVSEVGVAGVLSGAELRAAVLAGATPLAKAASPDTEALLLNIERDYDDGEFGEVARRAQQAQDVLAADLPSERRETITREVELLWGAALLLGRNPAAASAHFERALTTQAGLIADPVRFAPPVRDLLDRTRAQLAKRKRAVLEVSGSGETVFVDGVARGPAPLKLELVAHRATVWLEANGEASLAHLVDVGVGDRPLRVDIDLAFEGALRGGPEVSLALPAQRTELVRRVAYLAGASDVVVLERTEAGKLLANRFGAAGKLTAVVEVAQGANGAPPDWTSVARQLLPQPVPRSAVSSAALFGSGPAPARSFPWLTVGLVAGGVLLVGGGVAIGFAAVPAGNAILRVPVTGTP